MRAAIVIPARYGSSRFPGKPMHVVAGRSMLERVWRIAKAVPGANRIVIATEDERIKLCAETFGAEAVMTPASCENGTERMHAAIDAARIEEDILINFQGDALLTPPWVIDAMIAELEHDPTAELATPAVPLDGAQLAKFRENKLVSPASGTTVVFDVNRNALYFSKIVLPYMRKAGDHTVYRHVGLYGYRVAGLERYIALPPSRLELLEGLEQLRALENGMKIRIALVDYRGRTHGSVDAPGDVAVTEDIIAREGELVPD